MYRKRQIEISDIPALQTQLQTLIKAANNSIEHIRCVFIYQDDTIIHMYTAFDFIDNYKSIMDTNQIEKFYLYQLIDKSIS